VRAYVLIQIELGAQAPNGSLLSIPGIVGAEQLSGPYDAIALAVTGGGRSIDAVLDDVRLLPGVLRVIAAPLTRRPDEPRVPATPATGSEAA
jgi:hypothetical protein